jgi:hypothetical protein
MRNWQISLHGPPQWMPMYPDNSEKLQCGAYETDAEMLLWRPLSQLYKHPQAVSATFKKAMAVWCEL